ncbi:MAG: FAD-binding protein, partial [Pseudomonadota bacterium]|nr:FAD-binding protein [Pseudomonadota bacterium]
MRLIEQADLSHLNSMRLPSQARYLAIVQTVDTLRAVLGSVTAKRYPLLVIGGGSNLLLARHLSVLAIRPDLRGIVVRPAPSGKVWVDVMAGEPWHAFVQYCLAQGWYGLENLSLIPGTVGAAPIQNIGAYGVEVAERLVWVEAIHVPTGRLQRLSVAACAFGYRDSRFKQEVGQWVITQ